MSVLYHPGKANVVVNCLCQMNVGSVSHLDEAKKDIVKEVHRLARLGVRLDGSPNGGAIVYYNPKSSLVVEVKSKQHLDLALMEMNEWVLDKLNESFSLGWDGVKVPREIMCSRCRWVNGSDPRRITWVPPLNSVVVNKNVP